MRGQNGLIESKVLSMYLPEMELVAYISPMGPRGRDLVCTAIAVVFGFMSLFHGPVMTFAKASPAPAHPMSHHVGHHNAPPAQDSQPAKSDSAPVCYAFGCFIALHAVALRAPAAIFNSIGVLSPALAEALHPADIEPAVPPPRLNV